MNLIRHPPRYINNLDIVLLCGGNATAKLGRAKEEKLQCMVTIERRPLLSYIIDQISAFGANRAIIALGEGSKEIRKLFKNRHACVDLYYSYEEEPLGTGGAAKKAITEFGDRKNILIYECNTYTNFNIFDMRKFLTTYEETNTICSLGYNSESFIVKNNKLPELPYYSTGIYLVNYDYLLSLPDRFSLKYDIEKTRHILNGIHNRTIDLGTNRWNIFLCQKLFRDIWGYDWERDGYNDDDIRFCEYCKNANRVPIRKNVFHRWNIFCTILKEEKNRLGTCNRFEIKSRKPYTRIKNSGTEEV